MVTLIPKPKALEPIVASDDNMVGTKAIEAAPNEFQQDRTSLRPRANQACLGILATRWNLPLAILVGPRYGTASRDTRTMTPQMAGFSVPRTLALRVT